MRRCALSPQGGVSVVSASWLRLRPRQQHMEDVLAAPARGSGPSHKRDADKETGEERTRPKEAEGTRTRSGRSGPSCHHLCRGSRQPRRTRELFPPVRKGGYGQVGTVSARPLAQG